ncbi:hypothetical protein WJ0W_006855 [Paenibacillus melissococcoides]|uniref:histidine kinase n=1 Tax=Paenibacillus melissococcoides TaxID=2912268 RepID=A0ABN8UEL9_9BACL|nr:MULTISPECIES: histidine kinase dimerization/phospho-acceptor domain-containing protein [Paenibacillus]MEB9895168.1 hypothetical protein [Bacillus cereus]CAH8249671.1 hypothetical protein WJ0W_006855 [Paenibacillus melissococcoides]CAH8721503.1 hypothetical protein WDD9_006325 [Paenibacillus melissococcoides]CAH8721716.1 hypothetical protein HTL2_006501 [Paenibacillus melissococcoides]GIO82553.1 hypothetical protein J6TS7_61630 [Paenibacillus dendritiformis]
MLIHAANFDEPFNGGLVRSIRFGSQAALVKEVATVYYLIDILVAIIGFSTYWFKKYIHNAKENAKLNEQLKEADQLRGQFLANTSHELRMPLHGIMNVIAMLNFLPEGKPVQLQMDIADRCLP